MPVFEYMDSGKSLKAEAAKRITQYNVPPKEEKMRIFIIGTIKKSAEVFFGLIKTNGITTFIDIRLNNTSQLAGFSKAGDLEYFLREICGCDYKHELIFAPTKELMDGKKTNGLSNAQYETEYRRLMDERQALSYFSETYGKHENLCLLCSEETPENCHRQVLADMIANESDILKHL